MAISGQGTLFQRETTPGGGTFTTVAQVLNLGGPSMSRDTIDTTTLDVPDGYRTFIAALRDSGTLAVALQFVAAEYDLFKTDFESDTPVLYNITLPDGSTLEFKGLVTELPLAIPVDDKITCDVTIKISGIVTFTAA